MTWSVAVACSDTLVSVFGAEEVWERLGIFGGVGSKSIAANAIVGESFLL